MVKNDAGGNKGKGLARKHVNAAKCGSSKQLRVATDAAERYATVSKMLGNGMCYVRLLDGSTRDRLCIIRNKFKGRGKRDNILDSGSWVLVGMREWSSKQDTCDLLEVYNANERDRLLKNEPCFKAAETDTNNNHNNHNNSGNHNSVQFADRTTMKYSSMLNKSNGKDSDADADADDDDVLLQQRVYDMPPSDSDESDKSDESDSDEDENEDDVSEDNDEDVSEDKDEDVSEDVSEDEVQAEVPVYKSKLNVKACEINVDDI
jgi:translation initiation factor IF-1